MKKQRIPSLLLSLTLFGFLLGIHDGKLALWKDQDPIPCRIFAVPISMLPQDTQNALQRGIPIESMEDLEKFIEKYLP